MSDNSEVQNGWNDTDRFLETIYGQNGETFQIDFQKGPMQDYINEKLESEINALFEGSNVAGCMDDRLLLGRKGTAGTFVTNILNYKDDTSLSFEKKIDAALDDTVSMLEYESIDIFTTHDRCGANALVYGLLAESLKEGETMIHHGEAINDADHLGRIFVSELTGKYNETYNRNAVHEHIPFDDMIQTDYHLTRVIYVVDSELGSFNPNAENILYPGFVVSNIDEKQASSDVMLAMDIIKGDHGFSDLTDNEKILIVPIYKAGDLDSITQFGFLNNLPENYRESAFIDGFGISPQPQAFGHYN